MEGRTALENGLRQKLTSMENAVARLASVKAHLRGNSEQVRKEISNLVSHHLSLIRSREQELMQQLDSVVGIKESVLAQQQECINQSIGACQQSLDCLRRSGCEDVIDVKNVLFRLNTLDLAPRENSHISLEADSMALRKMISEFGRIITGDHAAKSGESLPVEMEDYEDDMGMVHKSVLRMPPSQSSPSIGNTIKTPPGNGPASRSVHNWLTKMPSGPRVLETDVAALMREYEEVQNQQHHHATRSRDNSTSASSFEVVARRYSICAHDENFSVLPDAMKEILDRPMDDWLLQRASMSLTPQSPKKAQLFLASPNSQASLPANMKRKLSPEPEKESKTRSYEFETVITGISGQDDASWITKERIPEESIPSSCASMTTVVSAPIIPFKVEFPRIFPDSTSELASKLKKVTLEATQTELPFDEAAYLSKLKSLFPPVSPAKPVEGWLEKPVGVKNDRPINEAADDVSTMQAVLGWKSILERIHASGEDNWLAPSARVA